MSLLEVDGLEMRYGTERGEVRAVDGVDLKLNKGQSLGIAGESGCGKSSLALTMIKLLPRNARIVSGRMVFDGRDLVTIGEEEMRKAVRWKRIAIVFQGAMNALTPVHKVGFQISEAIMAHSDYAPRESWKRSRELLALVGIDPRRADDYPHEFSGGMRQRAMIAMALACSPDLLIADEPTTALDVIVQAQIIALLKDLQRKLDLSLIVISHDISILTQLCGNLAIMYAGKIVEYAETADLFQHPLHPYTQGLLAAIPSIRSARARMLPIPGSPPDLTSPPPACRFHPRCPIVQDICKRDEPAFREVAKGHWAACHFAEKGLEK